jgi:hypothetical protein
VSATTVLLGCDSRIRPLLVTSRTLVLSRSKFARLLLLLLLLVLLLLLLTAIELSLGGSSPYTSTEILTLVQSPYTSTEVLTLVQNSLH